MYQTKVFVSLSSRSWEKAMWCEKRSLRLDVEASSADEKQPGAKSNDSEPEEKKKAKKRASKSRMLFQLFIAAMLCGVDL